MASKSKTWLILVALVHLMALKCMQQVQRVHGEPQVPCLFIFGDSLSDSGNNNNLPTTAKANYKPYGIDFPTGPTGRFTNGLTSIDFITKLLEIQNLIPPYANTTGQDILKGVNYASGAAGIRPETATHMGAVISLGLQFENHKVIVLQIATRVGGYDKAVRYLSKCLYYVNIGSNDYVNNYFLPKLYPTSRFYSPQQYAKDLVDRLSLYLQKLHDVGARKYVVVGTGLLGCTLYSISKQGTNGSCVQEENAASFMFNDNLKTLVDQFNNKFSNDSKFIFVNSTDVPPLNQSLGFTVTNASCCPSGTNGQCIPEQMACQNRNQYIFYDEIHPTEAVDKLNAAGTYDSSSNPSFTYPMDIKHLVQLS